LYASAQSCIIHMEGDILFSIITSIIISIITSIIISIIIFTATELPHFKRNLTSFSFVI
jgi:hypothetical protein